MRHSRGQGREVSLEQAVGPAVLAECGCCGGQGRMLVVLLQALLLVAQAAQTRPAAPLCLKLCFVGPDEETVPLVPSGHVRHGVGGYRTAVLRFPPRGFRAEWFPALPATVSFTRCSDLCPWSGGAHSAIVGVCTYASHVLRGHGAAGCQSLVTTACCPGGGHPMPWFLLDQAGPEWLVPGTEAIWGTQQGR